ncbi:hypothetical protein HK102_011986, partial [Quaeritorhiza haematococci]
MQDSKRYLTIPRGRQHPLWVNMNDVSKFTHPTYRLRTQSPEEAASLHADIASQHLEKSPTGMLVPSSDAAVWGEEWIEDPEPRYLFTRKVDAVKEGRFVEWVRKHLWGYRLKLKKKNEEEAVRRVKEQQEQQEQQESQGRNGDQKDESRDAEGKGDQQQQSKDDNRDNNNQKDGNGEKQQSSDTKKDKQTNSDDNKDKNEKLADNKSQQQHEQQQQSSEKPLVMQQQQQQQQEAVVQQKRED